MAILNLLGSILTDIWLPSDVQMRSLCFIKKDRLAEQPLRHKDSILSFSPHEVVRF